MWATPISWLGTGEWAGGLFAHQVGPPSMYIPHEAGVSIATPDHQVAEIREVAAGYTAQTTRRSVLHTTISHLSTSSHLPPNMAPKTSHDQYPPFSSTVPTAPLVSIKLSALESGDASESSAFFEACKDLGFFYLDMVGSELGESIVEESEKLHALQQEFFALPRESKDVYTQEKIGPFYAYRPIEQKDLPVDKDGQPRRNESYNVSRPKPPSRTIGYRADSQFRKDDILGHNPNPRPVHPLVWAQRPLLQSYTRHCRAVIDLMLVHLERHLSLAPGTLGQLHRINEMSGDHVRFNQTCANAFDPIRAKGGEHTDFGTLTVLMNWQGGLQIRNQQQNNDWVYVKPVPGSAVVNLGDALVIFSAGILRSNIHRVVPPPAPQDGVDRNSLVYFSRPEDAAIMQRLKGGVIDAQPKEVAAPEPMTSDQWIMRRALGDLRGVFTHKGGFELRSSAYLV